MYSASGAFIVLCTVHCTRATCDNLIKLVSSAGTGHYYTTDKNKRNTPDKLEFKKYDPKIRKHVVYSEAKVK